MSLAFWVESAGVIIFLFLILLSNLAETSHLSVNQERLRRLACRGNRSARAALKLAQNLDQLLGATIVIVNASMVGASILVAHIAVTHLHLKPYVGLFALALILVTLLFCEVVPKGYAVRRAERVALKVSRPFLFLASLLKPFVALVSALGNALLRPFGSSSEAHSALVEARLRALAVLGREEGALREEERRLIEEILEFGKIRVKEIMVPRPDIVAVPSRAPISEVAKIVVDKGHSRIPVYEDSKDNVIGVAYAKDLLKHLREGKFDLPVKEIMRAPLYVPETMLVEDLLRQMQRERVHIAIVVDEYGGTAGLVTLEDLLEELVGEIQDEHDRVEARVRWIDERTAIVDGLLNRDEVEDFLGVKLPEGDFDTLAGFIVSRLGRLPKPGDRVEYGGAVFQVLQVVRRRITKIRFTKPREGEGHGG